MSVLAKPRWSNNRPGAIALCLLLASLTRSGAPNDFVFSHGLETIPKADEVIALGNGPKFAEAYIPVFQRRRANPRDVLRFLREGAYFVHITNATSNNSWGEFTEGTLLTKSNQLFTWRLGENVLLLRAAPDELGYFVITNIPATTPAIPRSTPDSNPWARYEELSPPTAHEVVFWKVYTHGVLFGDSDGDAAYFTGPKQFDEVLDKAIVDTNFETWKATLRAPSKYQWGVLLKDNYEIIYWRTWRNRIVQLITEDGRACILKDPEASTPK